MDIYFAGIQKSYIEQLPKDACVLVSYDQLRQTKLIPELYKKGYKILLDSGAFSVWNSGKKPICPKVYSEFVQEKEHMLSGVIALDVITGSPDDQLKNLEILSECEKIMPVFHEDSDFQLLKEYINLGYKYICLSAFKSMGTPKVKNWIDDVLEKFPPSKDLYYHGLGMTQRILIQEYQGILKSVDSTTWLAFQKWGIEGNKYLLKNRTPEFYRQLGFLVMQDLAGQNSGDSKKHPHQISLFDWM